MIKKIAVTASTLLFVLAQIFSFYIIYENQRQKIELVKEKENQELFQSYKKLSMDISHYNVQNELQDMIVVKFFRDNMPEDSALYKNDVCLFNNSNYEFKENLIQNHTEYSDTKNGWREKKIGKKRILINVHIIEELNNKYISYHAVNVTSMYESSQNLIIKEILISFFMSAGMAVLLIILIQRITRPLQDTNKLQHQLISSMSHELKTPLTAMQGYSDTLLNVKLTPKQRQKALSYIRSETGRLARLSEKMMELTRLYEPECRIEMSEVNIKELLNDVKKSVEHKLKEKEIILQIEMENENLVNKLDRDLMMSFLINLINNSIMASKTGSIISMGADKRGIWVMDQGCGISGKEVEKVRKAFYRVDKSRSRKNGNMGLGLSICDQIAGVHKASMVIESKKDKGTKISFLYKSVTEK